MFSKVLAHYSLNLCAAQVAVEELCTEVKRLHTSVESDAEVRIERNGRAYLGAYVAMRNIQMFVVTAVTRAAQGSWDQVARGIPAGGVETQSSEDSTFLGSSYLAHSAWHEYQEFNALLNRLHFERLQRHTQ